MRTVHARKSTNHHNPAPSRTPAKRADRSHVERIRRLLETRRILTEVLDIQNDLEHGLWDRLFGTVEKLEHLRRSFEREAYDEAMHGCPTWAGPDRDATMARIFGAAGLYFPVGAQSATVDRGARAARLLDAAKDILRRAPTAPSAPMLTLVGGAL